MITFKIKIHDLRPDQIVVNEEFTIDVKIEEETLGTLVSKFEEESVRQEIGYTISEWKFLGAENRAKEIAVKRINRKIDYVKALKEMNKI